MEHKDLNRLKLVLVEKKRTGTWLAEQLRVSYVTVSKWCSNTTQPTLPTIDRYFVAIGRADAAAKFYVDKFNLPAQDALQYLLAI